MTRIRVYLGCSLDGFIAGPDDDLSFLHAAPPPDPSEPDTGLDFPTFLSQVGALLMGRRTHDVIAALGAWPYGDLPVLVATHRPLMPAAPTVRAVRGPITTLIAEARLEAGTRDVYLDGGDLVRQGLDAGLVDELCLTFVPTLLGGSGIRLFDGLVRQQALRFSAPTRLGGMVQVTAAVASPGPLPAS